MKTLLALLFCTCIFTSSAAQPYLKGSVINASTREPIAFVNIGITKTGTGTVSDENGEYRLRISSPEDMVTFSSIGYHTAHIAAKKLMETGEVALRQKPYNIPAIELKASSLTREVVLGAKLKERGHSVGFGSSELGTEIGALIEIDRETFIKSAHFTINHAAGDSMLFRVNVYDFSTGKAGENLLPENLIITAAQEKGTIDVDLSGYNLTVAKDVLLALEWIKDDRGKGNVGITFRSQKSKRGNNLYTKHTSQAPFIKASELVTMAPKLQLGFYLTGKQ